MIFHLIPSYIGENFLEEKIHQLYYSVPDNSEKPALETRAWCCCVDKDTFVLTLFFKITPLMAQFGGSIPSFSISSNYQTNHIAIPNMQHDLSTSSSTISLRRSPSYYDMTPKNQTKSKSKIVKRSKSTPNLKAVISPSSDPDSPEDSAEKKRSKLGYHRTSVACGQCF